ncbi:MAG: citrate synthase [Erysipelotrichaceae bacterium]|nr:citrate synthase [Erysipelotrichaceae bacterium]
MNQTLQTIFQQSTVDNYIANKLYHKYDVKKGLRNEDGTGVLIGLTRIADVVGYQMIDGKKIDDEGQLYYRGISIFDLVRNFDEKEIRGYEETCFLILFGHLPDQEEFQIFKEALRSQYSLPDGFLETNILRYPSMNIMNKIQRSLLMLYETDADPDNSSVENTFQQGLSIIAKMPAMMCYAYQAKAHLFNHESLFIHHPDPNVSIAENILMLIRPTKEYTYLEAKILDLMLVLHADHGAGNNSTFTNIVVSSTDTDIYSAFAASVGSLKGPRHGGANLAAKNMMKAVIDTVGLDATDEELKQIAIRLLQKDFYDQKGLIYGMGHAVYTLSDPRSVILKQQAKALAVEKEMVNVFEFYERFEQIAKQTIYEMKHISVCSNIDFYSGLIYEMLMIPEDLYSPMFVASRCVGWLAHNIENKLYCNRIVRPAGKYVGEKQEYVELEKR